MLNQKINVQIFNRLLNINYIALGLIFYVALGFDAKSCLAVQFYGRFSLRFYKKTYVIFGLKISAFSNLITD